MALLAVSGLALPGAAHVAPRDVAVLYNSAVPESEKLARLYCQLRKVPEAQLIGLEMPAGAAVTREQYEEKILRPLARTYTERGYWSIAADRDGRKAPQSCTKPVLLLMRGVPLRINPAPRPEDYKLDPAKPFAHRDDASVDSELALAGLTMLPSDEHPVGPLNNPYYEKTVSIRDAKCPFVLLTCRIDGPSAEVCERMMRDALAAEATGLWGMAYVDFSNKGDAYKMGEDWLENIVKANLRAGVPTVTDRFADTFPKNYPMSQASLYYGWYDWHVSGPFLNPEFRFRPGAVAVHLHSFSGQQLGDVTKNWCAPLLERGAAAVVGNVFEPYLHLTHHFDILHDRLLKGWTWVEAAWASIPVASWQGLTLGDPLYRPFAKLDGSGRKAGGDSEYIALRMAALKWGKEPEEMDRQLLAAGQRMESGVLMEAVGLRAVADGRPAAGRQFFDKARGYYKESADKARMDFHGFAELRARPGGKEQAVQALRAARKRYAAKPEGEAIDAWLDILDPPPPPPADPPAPNSAPAKKK